MTINLLAVISLSWPFVAGLGALPALVPGKDAPPGENGTLYLLAAAWSFGLCANYALVLLIGALGPALAAGAVLALCLGLAALWRRRGGNFRPACWRPWVIAAIILAAATSFIVLTPLRDWDARSIWFFHAKMIFYGGGLSPAIGLTDGMTFHHPDYPMLVAAFGGEIAWVVGFWNEFLPKLSLALLLPVPILCVMTFRHTPLSMLVAALAFVLIPGQFLHDGYMDGYLALYSACAILFLVAWVEGAGDDAFLAAAGALGVVLGLKLDGQVALIAMSLSAGLLMLRGRLRPPRPSTRTAMVAAFPFVGYFTWHVLAVLWSLHRERFSLANAWPRFEDPAALWQIADSALLQARVSLPVLAVLGVYVFARRKRPAMAVNALFPLLAGLLYLAGMCLILAMTAADLTWQLQTAAGRIMRTGTALVAAAAILTLRDLERADERSVIARLSESCTRWLSP